VSINYSQMSDTFSQCSGRDDRANSVLQGGPGVPAVAGGAVGGWVGALGIRSLNDAAAR